ncbi:leukocyte elastase inhibitor-like [Planococcus citri]|uniref:leukocyte elastase inhibitor-like n=1 Tax=Planococcus citri TaxID=170843 RepID=UPI0031F9171E
MRSLLWIVVFVMVSIRFSTSQNFSDANYEIVQNGVLNLGLKLNSILSENNVENKNILFSPLNIYTILSLLHLASNGSTRDEIASVLGIPATYSTYTFHQALKTLSLEAQNSSGFESSLKSDLKPETKASNLSLANGIFVQKGIDIKKTYVEDAQRYYNGEILDVDFSRDNKQAQNTINKYIANKTENQITELLKEPPSQSTILMLTSSLNFKANWLEIFPEVLTKPEIFHASHGNITVQMMSNLFSNVSYAKIPSLGVEAVELKYVDKLFSMYIVLPNTNRPLKQFLRDLNTEAINKIINEIGKSDKADNKLKVGFKLPKTAFKWSQSIKNQLISLGLADKQVFQSPDLANMIDGRNIQVSDISHGADIKINEFGTEASAASAAKVMKKSGGDSVVFHVDRPFFFFIFNRKINTVLFFGTVYDPNMK